MSPIERLLFRRVPFWLVLLLLIGGGVGSLLFAWAAQRAADEPAEATALQQRALAVARAPDSVLRVLTEGVQGAAQPRILDYPGETGFVDRDPDFQDPGYLLVSAYDDAAGTGVVSLLRVGEETPIHQWIPDIEAIHAQSTDTDGTNRKRNYRAQHPLLTEDGGILVTSGEGPLTRIDRCSAVEWVADRHFHHSIEWAPGGKHVHVPHVMDPPAVTLGLGPEGPLPLRDDGFAKVSLDGDIVDEWSVSEILLDNGYLGLLYGVGLYETDRVHLNDAEAVGVDDAFVESGDIMLSSRHLSTVLLYRPRTNEVLWLRTGPWLSQHDMDYLGDGVFSIFGNDTVRMTPDKGRRITPYSAIWLYDMKTDSVRRALSLENADVAISSQGLHTWLENGDVFIDDARRLLRLAPDGAVRWAYTSPVGEDRIGALHWARYLRRDQIPAVLLNGRECP
jgi:hypothetical protein